MPGGRRGSCRSSDCLTQMSKCQWATWPLGVSSWVQAGESARTHFTGWLRTKSANTHKGLSAVPSPSKCSISHRPYWLSHTPRVSLSSHLYKRETEAPRNSYQPRLACAVGAKLELIPRAPGNHSHLPFLLVFPEKHQARAHAQLPFTNLRYSAPSQERYLERRGPKAVP